MLARESLSLTRLVKRENHSPKSIDPFPSVSRSAIIWKIAPFFDSNPSEVMAALSSNFRGRDTLDVDASSLISIKEIKGLLDSQNLLLTDSILGVLLGIEAGFGGSGGLDLGLCGWGFSFTHLRYFNIDYENKI
jgi:hypothetical protein